MTTKDLNNWIMYHEIHKLNRLGFSNRKIADYLVMDPRTVKKYLRMDEGDFEEHLLKGQYRSRVLSPYEDFVRDSLERYPETSAAQMHDWLKEHHPGFPDTGPRTVYNFVMFVRQKHNIPAVKVSREYFPVPELPYGEQAQIDFGLYNMRQANGKRKKVSFFSMVLSRSRMKFIWFWDRPYTALDVCRAHERAFAFFGGIPRTVVYDQDRTMVVDENASERAIRNIKVKQKISGQFRKDRAAQNFAMIRSVIDTTIKNGMNLLEALSLIAKLQPQRVD